MKTEYARQLNEILQSLAEPERAVGAKAYMRNQFEFYGVATPERRRVVRELVADLGLPEPNAVEAIVKELWKAPQRELQYCAIDLLQRCTKRSLKKDLELFEYCVVHKSWWDTVDYLAARVVGPYFKRYPEERDAIVERWIHHKDMWLNRTAIIFQLGYKKTIDTALLERAILPHCESKEFFLQKAIGWALRSHSYVDAAYVKDFVRKHQLKPLSVREALKAINRDGL